MRPRRRNSGTTSQVEAEDKNNTSKYHVAGSVDDFNNGQAKYTKSNGRDRSKNDLNNGRPGSKGRSETAEEKAA